MQYFGRNRFVMTILRTPTYRKSLNKNNLRAGKRGVPHPQNRQTGRRRGLFREGEGNGAPGRSRTSDLLVRSQLLYPAELRAHIAWGCNSLTILEFAAQSKRPTNDQMRIWKGVVRPEGFEPPTLWFVAKCSIQLSYGRTLRGLQPFKDTGFHQSEQPTVPALRQIYL